MHCYYCHRRSIIRQLELGGTLIKLAQGYAVVERKLPARVGYDGPARVHQRFAIKLAGSRLVGNGFFGRDVAAVKRRSVNDDVVPGQSVARQKTGRPQKKGSSKKEERRIVISAD